MDCKRFRWVLKRWEIGSAKLGALTFDHSVKFQAENRGKAIKRPTFTKCIRQGCQCGILEPTTDHKIFRFVLFGVNLPTLT